MKNALLLAVLLGAAAMEAQPALAQTQPQPSKKDQKRLDKARKQTGPEVYKGTVAEQQRIITDAPGAEKDRGDGDGDEASTKKVKRKNK